ncbi:MAG: LacI family DNA-binding transcriptional regulator [Planctomycetes bacterium]|nr:LacI family DNA-binding transcriptional regulator [Planctomycetota bacterium]
MARVLLRDVAAAARISLATASRALRDDRRISAAVRARVHETALALGYRPDLVLSALSTYRAHQAAHGDGEALVLITSWPRLDPSPQWRAVDERCRRHGFAYQAVVVGTDPGEQRACCARLRAAGHRALILSTGVVPRDELQFDWEAFSCIGVGGAPSRRFHTVLPDYAGDLRLALEQVQAAGCRRPGLVLSRDYLRFTGGGHLGGWGHAHELFAEPPPPLLASGCGDAGQFRTWLERWWPTTCARCAGSPPAMAASPSPPSTGSTAAAPRPGSPSTAWARC